MAVRGSIEAFEEPSKAIYRSFQGLYAAIQSPKKGYIRLILGLLKELHKAT